MINIEINRGKKVEEINVHIKYTRTYKHPSIQKEKKKVHFHSSLHFSQKVYYNT